MNEKGQAAQIRRCYKRKRDAMPAPLAGQLSLQISQIVLGWNLYRNAERVSFYYPLGNEVSLVPVMEDALQKGKRIAFPKTVGDRMDFYEVTDLRELQEGCFHVMEPQTEGRKPVSFKPEICFVPGTVFDRKGGRYGYGRGYYDRYFAKKSAGKLVGCAYEWQVVDELPLGAWDVRMDALLSENGVAVCTTIH